MVVVTLVLLCGGVWSKEMYIVSTIDEMRKQWNLSNKM